MNYSRGVLTLQYTATHCNTLQHTEELGDEHISRSPQTATHYNTLLHAATHCSKPKSVER